MKIKNLLMFLILSMFLAGCQPLIIKEDKFDIFYPEDMIMYYLVDKSLAHINSIYISSGKIGLNKFTVQTPYGEGKQKFKDFFVERFEYKYLPLVPMEKAKVGINVAIGYKFFEMGENEKEIKKSIPLSNAAFSYKFKVAEDEQVVISCVVVIVYDINTTHVLDHIEITNIGIYSLEKFVFTKY